MKIIEEIIDRYLQGALVAAGKGHASVPINVVTNHIKEMGEEIRVALATDKELGDEACILLERACAYAGDAIPASILKQAQDLHARSSGERLKRDINDTGRLSIVTQ